jgi:hypothetical protein
MECQITFAHIVRLKLSVYAEKNEIALTSKFLCERVTKRLCIPGLTFVFSALSKRSTKCWNVYFVTQSIYVSYEYEFILISLLTVHIQTIIPVSSVNIQIWFLFHVNIGTIIPVSGGNIQTLFLFHVNIDTIIPVSGGNIKILFLFHVNIPFPVLIFKYYSYFV